MRLTTSRWDSRSPMSPKIVRQASGSDSRSVRAGADGFLVKSTAPSDLPDLIRVAARGHRILSREAAEHLIADRTDDLAVHRARDLVAHLTRRERAVLEGVARGDAGGPAGPGRRARR